MPTFQSPAGQITPPRHITAGTLITLQPGAGATLRLEYTLQDMASIRNGAAVWLTWPKGPATSTMTDLTQEEMYIRTTSTGGASTFVTEPRPSMQTLQAYKTAFTSHLGGGYDILVDQNTVTAPKLNRVRVTSSNTTDRAAVGDTLTVSSPPGVILSNIQGMQDKSATGGSAATVIAAFTSSTYVLTATEIPPVGADWPIYVYANTSNETTDALSIPNPPTVPAAPTMGTATASNLQISAPYTDGNNGGRPITSHDAFLYDIDGNLLSIVIGVANPAILDNTNAGVVNGKLYKVKVRANSAAGSGPISVIFSNSVQPLNIPALPTPVILDPLDTTTGFTTTNATQATDTINKRQGAGSIQLTCGPATGSGYTDKLTSASYTPSALGTLVGLFNVSTFGSLISESLQILRGGNGIQSTRSDNATKSRLGWRAVAIHTSEGDSGWQNSAAGTLRLRPKFDSTLANTVVGNVDAIYSNAAGYPTYCATFDDAHIDQYNVVFPLFKQLGLKGTLFIPTQYVGLNGRLTWAMIREMRDSGLFQIGLDSTRNDGVTSTDPATVVAELDAGRADLASNNALDGKGGEFFLCWTFGTLPSEAVLAAVQAAGYKLARGVEPQINYTRMGFLDQGLALYAQGFNNNSTTSTFNTYYNRAKIVGATFVTLTHGCNDGGGSIDMPYTSVALPSWTQVANDIAAGNMQTMTFLEWWNRDNALTPP